MCVYNCRLVQHPNLSSFLGIVPVGQSRIAIVTPLVQGGNLHDHLFREHTQKVCSITTGKVLCFIHVPLCMQLSHRQKLLIYAVRCVKQ